LTWDKRFVDSALQNCSWAESAHGERGLVVAITRQALQSIFNPALQHLFDQIA
jgi:hypothetical protein